MNDNLVSRFINRDVQWEAVVVLKGKTAKMKFFAHMKLRPLME
jgi:hypothetical protein